MFLFCSFSYPANNRNKLEAIGKRLPNSSKFFIAFLLIPLTNRLYFMGQFSLVSSTEWKLKYDRFAATLSSNTIVVMRLYVDLARLWIVNGASMLHVTVFIFPFFYWQGRAIHRYGHSDKTIYVSSASKSRLFFISFVYKIIPNYSVTGQWPPSLWHTVQCSTVQHSTVQRGIVQHNARQHSTAQYSTAHNSTAQCITLQQSTAQYSAV